MWIFRPWAYVKEEEEAELLRLAEANLIDLFFMPKRITCCRRGADYS